ncbi:hypothetical protein [Vibrio campbellii]|uniref:hypothetical protein n=1 Tax=Vibrio campbellii TaxID=680 RepID=UPI0005773A11|nr:hypothetical protein [Vibrio campbellii]ARV75524.1 hypothetical protein A8140_23305 [Vibrio campbellii CAIM 519 = NBRC 15631 = ATCC 25920]
MKVKLLNKKLVSAFLMSILFSSGYVSANSEIKQDMSPVLTVEFEDQSNPENNQYLEELFKAFIAHDKSNLKYMLSEGFAQKFGGEKNSYNEFIKHSLVLSEQLTRMEIVFEDVNVSSDGTISEIHTVEVTKLDGSRSKLKLYAFYYFDQSGKLEYIDELSTLLEGPEEDKNMGSRTK